MSIKYESIRALNNKITSMKNDLYSEMSFIDYVMLLQNFWCLMIRTITKFTRTRVRNFTIFF